MPIFPKLSKTLNNAVNKSLTLYNNNTRLIRNKKKNWEKKFLSESKEYIYEIVSFMETRRGWWLKIFSLWFLFLPSLYRLYWILGGKKDKMLNGWFILDSLHQYEKDNIKINDSDQVQINKILSSYWINYT